LLPTLSRRHGIAQVLYADPAHSHTRILGEPFFVLCFWALFLIQFMSSSLILSSLIISSLIISSPMSSALMLRQAFSIPVFSRYIRPPPASSSSRKQAMMPVSAAFVFTLLQRDRGNKICRNKLSYPVALPLSHHCSGGTSIYVNYHQTHS
jgi:hypothetical protein